MAKMVHFVFFTTVKQYFIVYVFKNTVWVGKLDHPPLRYLSVVSRLFLQGPVDLGRSFTWPSLRALCSSAGVL